MSALLSATDDIGADETNEVVAIDDVVDNIGCEDSVGIVHSI